MNILEEIRNLKNDLGRTPRPDEVAKSLDLTYNVASIKLDEFNKIDKPKKNKTPFSLLPYIFLVVAIVSFILSLYFTGLWFIDYFMKPIAFGMSLMMVLYMVIAPQVFGKIKESDFIIKFTFILALVFSMGSTIAGQYNKATKYNSDIKKDVVIIETYRTQENELMENIKILEDEKTPHKNLLDQFSNDIDRRIDSYESYITEKNIVKNYNILIDEKNKQLEEVRGKILEELKEGNRAEERDDFFSFISKITKIKREWVELIISILPAIFLDMIAPLSAYISTRLLKEKGLK